MIKLFKCREEIDKILNMSDENIEKQEELLNEIY